MALIENTYSLKDIAARKDPDGKLADVAEIMMQSNTIIEDLEFHEGNMDVGERITVRKTLGSPKWKRYNEHVKPSVSRTSQVDEVTGHLEDWSEVDKDLADKAGNRGEFLLREAKPKMQAMADEMARITHIYICLYRNSDAKLRKKEPIKKEFRQTLCNCRHVLYYAEVFQCFIYSAVIDRCGNVVGHGFERRVGVAHCDACAGHFHYGYVVASVAERHCFFNLDALVSGNGKQSVTFVGVECRDVGKVGTPTARYAAVEHSHERLFLPGRNHRSELQDALLQYIVERCSAAQVGHVEQVVEYVCHHRPVVSIAVEHRPVAFTHNHAGKSHRVGTPYYCGDIIGRDGIAGNDGIANEAACAVGGDVSID